MTTDGDGGLDSPLPESGLSSDELVNRLGSDDTTVADVATAILDAERPATERTVEGFASHVASGADASLDEQEAITYLLVEIAARDEAYAPRIVEAFAAGIDDPKIETTVMRGLGELAERRPVAVDPVLDSVAARLTEEPLPVRQSAAEILDARADDDPGALTDLVPALVAAVTSTEGLDAHGEDVPQFEQQRLREQTMAEERFRQRVGEVLERIAAHEPGTVAAELEALVDTVAQSDRNLHTRRQVVAVVQSVAASSPAAAGEAIQPLVAIVEADDEPAPVRAAAANTLALIAEGQFERVTDATRSTVPALGDMLTADEETVRAAAAGLLSYLAQRHPEDVTALTDSLVDCLDCTERTVRASAVWTLSYLDTGPARDALRDVATDDPDPEVRSLAEELL